MRHSGEGPAPRDQFAARQSARLPVAEIELGLTFARMAERAGDAWLAARQRAKAEQAYETVLGLRDRLDLTQAAHADLSRGLEGLRLAIQRISRA